MFSPIYSKLVQLPLTHVPSHSELSPVHLDPPELVLDVVEPLLELAVDVDPLEPPPFPPESPTE
jgi:hypothetical protein